MCVFLCGAGGDSPCTCLLCTQAMAAVSVWVLSSCLQVCPTQTQERRGSGLSHPDWPYLERWASGAAGDGFNSVPAASCLSPALPNLACSMPRDLLCVSFRNCRQFGVIWEDHQSQPTTGGHPTNINLGDQSFTCRAEIGLKSRV